MKKFTLPLGGALLGIIGVALPWVTVSAGRLSRSVSGWDSKHGALFVGALALAALVAAILRAKSIENRILSGVLLVAGIGLGIIAFNDLQQLREAVGLSKKILGHGIKVEVGIGMWTLMGGLVVLTLGALFDLVTTAQHEEGMFLGGEHRVPSPLTPRDGGIAHASPEMTLPAVSASEPRTMTPPEEEDDLSIPLSFGSGASSDGAPASLVTEAAPVGMVRCPDCGQIVEEGFPFCPGCASPL